ncbi:uncharacterized protein LOC126891787 [Diabrotica virgifera virgifera]|uniref:C2H2-type domain-containing protein n=1 Tax=Diabrotica virgifera virgifera TaxID=50390 RepID=A0ABM5L3J8_DIAVI|nr:uncharacterized protein LOC126891787 [Diabrotica virgifera virgifera]
MDSTYPSTSTSPTSTNSLPGACHLCSKIFKNVELRNRHIKRIHKTDVPPRTNNKMNQNHIICPLCDQETNFESHEKLRKHLQDCHQLSIELITFEFSSKQEYETWKDMQKIETSYACSKTKRGKEHKIMYYDCNRSDLHGYKPNYKIRTEKAGGSIRIKGVCPSRLACKLRDQGQVSVSYWKTHVGHKEELRTMHLSKAEEKTVVEKLMAGVPPTRILKDSRKLEVPQLDRLAVITSQDLRNLTKKYNIHKKRDQNDMIAAALKVQEWNANNKNYAFLFKKEGEDHDILRKEDFAVGFMNAVMEEKLLEFPNIICVDGTHGTNKKGLDLTILLVKDDRNAGFPVAFLLSNRLDQQIQEVFLDALKNKIQTEVNAEYFMSDDDPKYYNAWKKIMRQEPRRLLCTWHVVKNWNIRGKKKLQDPTLKAQMKNELRQIIREPDEDKFKELCDKYVSKLEEANEIEFVSYLKNHYLAEHRKKLWPYCYRRNAGINTNMAIESLNNLLKTNYLKRNAAVGIEKLLDTMDELVEEKMWTRIVDIIRPSANNYQDRLSIRAHKRAASMKGKLEELVKETAYGHYEVKSFKGMNILRYVNFRKVCESECKTLFCRVCKICIHRYWCSCDDYMVRNTLCQHVHLVRMYEERLGSNSVVDDAARCLGEMSTIKSRHEEEINEFVRGKLEQTNVTQEKTKRSLQQEYLINVLNGLDDQGFTEYIRRTQGILEEVNNKAKNITKKRKMETQEYFHSKKKKRTD